MRPANPHKLLIIGGSLSIKIALLEAGDMIPVFASDVPARLAVAMAWRF